MIETIRRKIPQEEFDYQTLMNCLDDYARPRDKITALLRKKAIIRVKKGIYVFGDNYRKRPYSREILANLIFGPSYISLDYALQYYGLIPERVETVTSVTTGRSRRFPTPTGLFYYRMIPLKAFRIGMDRIEIGDGRAFLIATPEKALSDKLYSSKGINLKTRKDMSGYLENELRIELVDLKQFNPDILDAAALGYRSKKLKILSNLIRFMN